MKERTEEVRLALKLLHLVFVMSYIILQIHDSKHVRGSPGKRPLRGRGRGNRYSCSALWHLRKPAHSAHLKRAATSQAHPCSGLPKQEQLHSERTFNLLTAQGRCHVAECTVKFA